MTSLSEWEQEDGVPRAYVEWFTPPGEVPSGYFWGSLGNSTYWAFQWCEGATQMLEGTYRLVRSDACPGEPQGMEWLAEMLADHAKKFGASPDTHKLIWRIRPRFRDFEFYARCCFIPKNAYQSGSKEPSPSWLP